MPKQQLIEADEGGDGGGALQIKVNQSYAKRFEHNKQREELHRLQSKHPELAAKLAQQAARQQKQAPGRPRSAQAASAGDEEGEEDEVEEESTSEEEDLGEIPDDTEAAILDTLLRIKRKDPVIYQPEVHFFDRTEGEEGDGEGGGGDAELKPKKAKPLFLKDVLAKQALEHGPEVSSDDEEEERPGAGRASNDERAPKAYDAEQEDLRRAFISAAAEADHGLDGDEEFGGVVKAVRALPGDDDEEGDGEEDGAEAGMNGRGAKPGEEATGGKGKGGAKKGKKLNKMVDAYFGNERDTNDEFLRQYILNKGWVDKTEADDYVPSYQEVVGVDGVVDDDEDEQYLEKADQFEATYNFRYEEPGGASIAGHPRVVEGIVRKEDDRRKRKRAEKAARLKEAEEQRKEEVKRLKNLKKKEIEEKLSTLQRVSGAATQAGSSKLAVDSLLDGDFDPEAWDKQMAQAFDDDYYEAGDEELEALMGGLEDEDELAIGLDPRLGEDDEEEAGAEQPGMGGEGRGEQQEEEEAGPSAAAATAKKGAKADGKADGKAAGPVRGTFKDLRRRLAELQDDGDAAGLLEEDGEGGDEEAKAAAAAKLARRRAEVQQLLEEYYRLDYEDSIAGINTRFRYKAVPALTFGLSTEDLLTRSDKELNQVAGLKRLAPYRDDQHRMRPNYKALQQLRHDKPASAGEGRKNRKQNKDPKAWQRKDQRAGGQHRGKEAGQAVSGERKERKRKAGKEGDEAGKASDGGAVPEGAVGKAAKKERPVKKTEKGQQSVQGDREQAGATGRAEGEHRTADGAVAAEGAGAAAEGNGNGLQGKGKSALGKRQGGPSAGTEAAAAPAQGAAKKQKKGKKAAAAEAGVDPVAARLASYAKLELRPGKDQATGGGEGGKKKGKGGKGQGKAGEGGEKASAAAAPPAGPALTKAQKKNLKRTRKRAVGKAEGS